MSENSPKPAILSWHLFIDCPECKEHVDLADLHSDYGLAQKVFNNKWGDLKGCDVQCPECGHEFKLDGVEY